MGFGMTVAEFTVVDTCSSRRYLVVSIASTSLTHNIFIFIHSYLAQAYLGCAL
jgi:hypothetical protein